MAIDLMFVVAILLSGSLTAAQDQYVRNFQVDSQNSNDIITFSWDIVDGYYNYSYINYFHIYYWRRSMYAQSLYVSYSSATRNGTNFRYTSSVGNFNNGPYIMWVRVYRSSGVYPRYTYSRRKFVNTSKVETYTVLELKVHLQPTQTCSEFLLLSSLTQTSREVNWILQQSCSHCIRTSPDDLSVQDGYFTCTTSDYVIFRAKLSTNDLSINLTSLTANLANILPDREAQIIVNNVEYLVEPGPCGLTVPHLDFPHCLNDTHGNVPPQDNTVTTATVAIMCSTMLILVLSTCVVFLVMGLQKINHRQTNTAEVKATRDVEMASISKGHSRSIPLQRGHDYAYTSTAAPIKSNPSYGMVN